MKRIFIIGFVILFSFKAVAANMPHSISTQNTAAATSLNPGNIFPGKTALSIKNVQKLIGRKLTLKEKIAWKVLQWKIRKAGNPQRAAGMKNKGKTAMILGIIGLACLFIPVGLFIIPCVAATVFALVLGYEARKENPNDAKAKAGIILGWITAGLVLLGIVIVIAVLSTISWWN